MRAYGVGMKWSQLSVLVAGFCSCGLLGMWHTTAEGQPKPDDSNALPEGQRALLAESIDISAPPPAVHAGDDGPARMGLVPWSSKGPRAPSNDIERRRSEIQEYQPENDLVFFSHIHKTSRTSLSGLLADIFPGSTVVPTSARSKALAVEKLQGHDEDWWDPFQVMYAHNRPNITDKIGVPATKTPRLLLVVRNPLMHKASIFFEFVCRFGRHIKDGKIDVKEATLARTNSKGQNSNQYNFCMDPELWIGSPQYMKFYRNFQASWLSYGAVEKHRCIGPQLAMNMWKAKWADKDGTCRALAANGKDAGVWEEYFERTADAAIRRLEGALWVGVTERMEESVCLLFHTLGKPAIDMPHSRLKEPRPISVWHQKAKEKAAAYDRADWKVFDAANDILDLRLWAVRERLEDAGEDERERLGQRCFDLLTRNDGAVMGRRF